MTNGIAQPARQQRNIEDVCPVGFLICGQQIKQQGRETLRIQAGGNAPVAGLNRLEPLPCTNTIKDLAPRGMCSVPAKPTGGMNISRVSASLGTW